MTEVAYFERPVGDYLHLVPVVDEGQHAHSTQDEAWCWCLPTMEVASVAERMRGLLRVVRHSPYFSRVRMQSA